MTAVRPEAYRTQRPKSKPVVRPEAHIDKTAWIATYLAGCTSRSRSASCALGWLTIDGISCHTCAPPQSPSKSKHCHLCDPFARSALFFFFAKMLHDTHKAEQKSANDPTRGRGGGGAKHADSSDLFPARGGRHAVLSASSQWTSQPTTLLCGSRSVRRGRVDVHLHRCLQPHVFADGLDTDPLSCKPSPTRCTPLHCWRWRCDTKSCVTTRKHYYFDTFAEFSFLGRDRMKCKGAREHGRRQALRSKTPSSENSKTQLLRG